MTGTAFQPILRVDAVQKRYGAAKVLDGVDLTVRGGQVVAIRGPNGSGKTTFLRIVATLTSPSAGEVSINGVNALTHSADARRHIGVVMHSPMLYSDLTVRENLMLFAKLCQLDSADRRVDAVVSRLNLTPRIDERVGRLSHGYRKRTAIARAILHQPSLLLLDEPETGLDDASLGALADIIHEWQSSERAVLIASHSSDFVASFADAEYGFELGRLKRDDTV